MHLKGIHMNLKGMSLSEFKRGSTYDFTRDELI